MSLKDIRTGEVTYAGKVLSTHWKSGVRIMSDVYADVHYAVIFDGGKSFTVSTGNDEMGATDEVTIDATPEVKRAYLCEQILADNLEIRRAYASHLAWLRTEASQLTKGKFVRVVKGRKVAKGTEGILFWMSNPGDSQWGIRVGIRDARGEVYWTSADNVEVDLEVEMVGGVA